MAKDIIKEIIIVLLLCLAIILILGVILYNYVPTNKLVPEQIEYTTSKDVKEMLKSADGVDEEKVVMTYTLGQSDLNNYQRINEYKPGKANPFSTYQTQNAEKTNSNSSSNGTSENSSGTSSGQNTNTDTSTPGSVNPGNYTNDKGLK